MTVSDLDKLFAINSISNNWPSFIFANGGFKKVSGIIVFDDGEEEILSPLIDRTLNSYSCPGEPPDNFELLVDAFNKESVTQSD